MQVKTVFDRKTHVAGTSRRRMIVARAEPSSHNSKAVDELKAKARETINNIKSRKSNMETMRSQNLNRLHDSIKQIVMDELSYVRSMCDAAAESKGEGAADSDQELAKTLEPLLKSKHQADGGSTSKRDSGEDSDSDNVFVGKL